LKDTRPPAGVTGLSGGSLPAAMIEFCRLLNDHGIPVSPGSAEHALRGVAEIDLSRRRQFRSVLRISLLSKPEDFPLFSDLFNTFWRTGGVAPVPSNASAMTTRNGAAQNGFPDVEAANLPSEDVDSATLSTAAALFGEQGAGSRHGLSAVTDASSTARDYRAALERFARALARQLAQRRSRRAQPSRRGRMLDYRRSMRHSLRYGGLPISLRWRTRQVTRARLVIFCDVSRSMVGHAHLLLQMAAAVLRHAWRVEVFLFGSDLVRVTDRWLEAEWSSLDTIPPRCGGGTLIGRSLEAFLHDYSYCLTGSKTTSLILSDGLDAGDPELLAGVMQRLQRRSAQVIWLNPLLSSAGYEPTARGMAAALPFVDVFAAGDNVTELWRLVAYLRGDR
jgi:uncharacterized protein with von Willebrand factor type A (vWA) domain